MDINRVNNLDKNIININKKVNKQDINIRKV